MNRHTQILASAALLIAAPFAANAAGVAVSPPVVLEAVVVTPKASYSASEWQARQASRQLAVAAPVVLDRVIVTPSGSYSLAEWRARSAERRYAAAELGKARHWLRAVWQRLGLRSYPQAV